MVMPELAASEAPHRCISPVGVTIRLQCAYQTKRTVSCLSRGPSRSSARLHPHPRRAEPSAGIAIAPLVTTQATCTRTRVGFRALRPLRRRDARHDRARPLPVLHHVCRLPIDHHFAGVGAVARRPALRAGFAQMSCVRRWWPRGQQFWVCEPNWRQRHHGDATPLSSGRAERAALRFWLRALRQNGSTFFWLAWRLWKRP
jgi:hypothetical protein